MNRRLLALALGAWLWAAPLLAIDLTPPLADPKQQQRYVTLIHELRCMQCQNETLADSEVSLAADLRLEVHDLIAQGKSDTEVRDYLVSRYGDFILFRPRVSWRTAWLWALPGLLLLAGAVAAIRVLLARTRLVDSDTAPIDSEPDPK
jgi:cytochrome c-type biogenesis protein CcmH